MCKTSYIRIWAELKYLVEYAKKTIWKTKRGHVYNFNLGPMYILKIFAYHKNFATKICHQYIYILVENYEKSMEDFTENFFWYFIVYFLKTTSTYHSVKTILLDNKCRHVVRVKRNEEFQESKEMMCERSTVQLLSAANGIISWHIGTIMLAIIRI